MKNKIIVIISTGVCLCGELIYGELLDNGIILKMSEKSCILMWIPVDEIIRVILPDASDICGKDLLNIYERMNWSD